MLPSIPTAKDPFSSATNPGSLTDALTSKASDNVSSSDSKGTHILTSHLPMPAPVPCLDQYLETLDELTTLPDPPSIPAETISKWRKRAESQLPTQTETKQMKNVQEIDQGAPCAIKATRQPTLTMTERSDISARVGISRSAMASKKLKAAMLEGTFSMNQKKLARFKGECSAYDSMAQFCTEDSRWEVFHSRCGKWVKITEAYLASRFVQHVLRCKTQETTRATTLDVWFKPVKSAIKLQPAPQILQNKVHSKPESARLDGIVVRPYNGITIDIWPEVAKLIERGVRSGGGQNVFDIS
ncbi:hypothetical protein HETIRDRAFT_107269 [Heterobasidion irregulare TC 32-1]|uniref:Uncharacterized protein n=1 Tax=Heterobasidion irregulare (strain TC 32-1) TaxID=747525 RepID=W4KBH6_HETIT|nr:uncharacterized protein HETIRDRAFT_107269 [Heterobasidion irregulare TC 32-1]ETW83148.1 hypothetical protein HETIRDRAFT_107269 [Heterobasidion irregulare TC 32-1]